MVFIVEVFSSDLRFKFYFTFYLQNNAKEHISGNEFVKNEVETD